MYVYMYIYMIHNYMSPGGWCLPERKTVVLTEGGAQITFWSMSSRYSPSFKSVVLNLQFAKAKEQQID